jgi:hypothetical protein
MAAMAGTPREQNKGAVPAVILVAGIAEKKSDGPPKCNEKRPGR